MNTRALVWFRQDLRCQDNPALFHACSQHEQVLALYIKDEATHPIGGAQRWWLHHSLRALEKNLQSGGLPLCLRQGNPLDILPKLLQQQGITHVYWNRCYEPLAISRDATLKQQLKAHGISVHSFNASLLNEPWTLQTQQGGFYQVFTPYWRQAAKHINFDGLHPYPARIQGIVADSERLEQWTLLPKKPNWAKAFTTYWEPGENGALTALERFLEQGLNGYDKGRDVPAKAQTSKLSPHLHFGEISPKRIAKAIQERTFTQTFDEASITRFMAELGWREFSYYLLYHFPSLPHTNFRKTFDAFPWLDDPEHLTLWQKGMTGYPIVDAGMRELWHTGYMHNRVRMIVASFLTKHLLVDWRKGAEWFLDTLVDADLASNSASWQWVAGCGADAAPYFRIFNPILQSQTFDAQGTYLRQWLPELSPLDNRVIHHPWALCPKQAPSNYPRPIIDHDFARKRALDEYQHMKNKGNAL